MKSTKTLRAKWFGPPPSVGDYLMSEKRPRGAYLIVTIKHKGEIPTVPIDLYGEPSLSLEFECSLVEVSKVPKDATIHHWKWSPRTKKPVVWK